MRYRIISVGLFLVGALIIGLLYGPLAIQEAEQYIRSTKPLVEASSITSVDTDFGIIIPKIGANSRIVKDVDPKDQAIYQTALSRGIAHAKGSFYPGEGGNVFLFAHSSVNVLEAQKYNSVFYLLHWMKPHDEIVLFYNQQQFRYVVEKSEIVSPDRVEYLYQFQPKEQLVLMTCWPPGTTLKRLLVTAQRIVD